MVSLTFFGNLFLIRFICEETGNVQDEHMKTFSTLKEDIHEQSVR